MEHIYSDKFKFSEVVYPVYELEVVDSLTLKTKTSDNYIKMTKSVANNLYRALGMGGAQFSNKLYSIDSKLWKELLDKKSKTETFTTYKNSTSVVAVDDSAVAVLEGSVACLDKFLDSINKFYNLGSDYLCEYSYDPLDIFVFKVTNTKEKYGTIVRLYLQSMWITVNNFYIDDTDLTVISPYAMLDKKLDDDIDVALDVATCLDKTYFDESSKNEYLVGLSIRMSVDELSWYLKKVLGVKVKYGVEVDPYDIATSMDLSESATSKVVQLTHRMYCSHEEPVTYYNSYLKRAVTMSPVTYGVVAEVVDALSKESKVDVKYLISLYDTIMRHNSHYQQLNN